MSTHRARTDIDTLATKVVEALRALGVPERREAAKTYIPTELEVLGVRTPELRSVVGKTSKGICEWAPSDILALAQALVDSRTLEGRLAAYELLARHGEAMSILEVRTIEELARGMDNWGAVDGFACLIAGPAWRAGRLRDTTIRKWARSKDRWWRRAAVVATVPLNRKANGGRGDTPRTLAICEMLVDDKDDMVAKGLSWALRVLSTSDRQAAEDFLEHHQQALSARVRRELRSKLDTGLKNAGRRR